MKTSNIITNLNGISSFIEAIRNNLSFITKLLLRQDADPIEMYKKGYKIKIKEENKGKFTEYCGGKVTSKCIEKGKNSPNPKIRKRAVFALNARHFKH